MACRYGEDRGGADSSPKERGGAPPKQACTPFVRGLIQEMGGSPQYLRRPPPAARPSEGARAGDEIREGPRGKEGEPSPLGGIRTPKDQARAVVDRIINSPLGGGPHNGQTPALHQLRAQPIRGSKGRGGQSLQGGIGEGDSRGRGRGVGEGDGITRQPHVRSLLRL